MEKKENKQVVFMDWLCDVNVKAKYSNGRRVISLTDAENFSPVMTASVNLPNETCLPDEVWIKDYSENQGIEQVLINAKIISKPIAMMVQGHVIINKCKILI
jgi:hypothetical protein